MESEMKSSRTPNLTSNQSKRKIVNLKPNYEFDQKLIFGNELDLRGISNCKILSEINMI